MSDEIHPGAVTALRAQLAAAERRAADAERERDAAMESCNGAVMHASKMETDKNVARAQLAESQREIERMQVENAAQKATMDTMVAQIERLRTAKSDEVTAHARTCVKLHANAAMVAVLKSALLTAREWMWQPTSSDPNDPIAIDHRIVNDALNATPDAGAERVTRLIRAARAFDESKDTSDWLAKFMELRNALADLNAGTVHHKHCDALDLNAENIRKPCNCGKALCPDFDAHDAGGKVEP